MTSSRYSPAPRVWAAAMGPGVGGMKTCAMYRPQERQTVIATLDLPVRLTSALRMGLRMTKPLSQKTGMDTTQPISSMASSGFFSPTREMTMSASFSAAPVFSSTEPMKAPRMMTMPMEVKVPEKPAPMTPGISRRGMPARIARTREMPMIARKGCTFILEIRRIIAMMAMTNAMISAIPVMFSPPKLIFRIKSCQKSSIFPILCQLIFEHFIDNVRKSSPNQMVETAALLPGCSFILWHVASGFAKKQKKTLDSDVTSWFIIAVKGGIP